MAIMASSPSLSPALASRRPGSIGRVLRPSHIRAGYSSAPDVPASVALRRYLPGEDAGDHDDGADTEGPLGQPSRRGGKSHPTAATNHFDTDAGTVGVGRVVWT